MQNNVTELTQKLLQSVDSNYNVTDMSMVIEVISLLENIAITKELLEATRLGKHVNELRRKTSNESLAKRAKELVKKWRNMVLPESNGQLRSNACTPTERLSNEDVNLNQVPGRKRLHTDKIENVNLKRPRVNGTSELDFSDNSNSSFKGVMNASKNDAKRDVILVNDDSNSSYHDARQDPVLEQQLPKKRGRKKGSKNHRSLLDEAESSFTSKMAVSRGNAKVKTTQELVASLQNRTSPSVNATSSSSSSMRPLDNLTERAAKLTERVSIIDQKLNTNSNRKNSQKKFQPKGSVLEPKKDRVIESGIVVNITKKDSKGDEEIIVVDDVDHEDKSQVPVVKQEAEVKSENAEEMDNFPKSLSIEEALALLPPIDRSCLFEEEEEEPRCTCILKEHKGGGFSIEDPDSEDEDRIEFIEDCSCHARSYLENKYHLLNVTEDRVHNLHKYSVPSVNGNLSLGGEKTGPEKGEDDLYLNVVPNVNTEKLAKQFDSMDFEGENYKRYSISDCNSDDRGGADSAIGSDIRTSTLESETCDSDLGGSTTTFREFHDVVEMPSYNGEILKILPYVIID